MMMLAANGATKPHRVPRLAKISPHTADFAYWMRIEWFCKSIFMYRRVANTTKAKKHTC
jgi:hypothetical protein